MVASTDTDATLTRRDRARRLRPLSTPALGSAIETERAAPRKRIGCETSCVVRSGPPPERRPTGNRVYFRAFSLSGPDSLVTARLATRARRPMIATPGPDPQGDPRLGHPHGCGGAPGRCAVRAGGSTSHRVGVWPKRSSLSRPSSTGSSSAIQRSPVTIATDEVEQRVERVGCVREQAAQPASVSVRLRRETTLTSWARPSLVSLSAGHETRWRPWWSRTRT